uniref:Uncharacterized protein n=1 Tax=Romanomermis culicivorax TaxID=13658 RepID=A0A915IZ60_ROMCU
MIRDSKKIVSLVNRSDPARKTYKVIQKEINIKKLPLKLLQIIELLAPLKDIIEERQIFEKKFDR